MNKTTHDERDTPDQNSVTEIETSTKNVEHNNGKENKLHITNFLVEMKNRIVEAPITPSIEQQIFTFKVITGTNQELWGVYFDFQSIHSKWTIDAI